MNWRAKFSAFVSRWVEPADAARVVAKHGAEARRMTVQQRYDDFHNRLRSEVQATKARSAS